jgi:hypothetical protein
LTTYRSLSDSISGWVLEDIGDGRGLPDRFFFAIGHSMALSESHEPLGSGKNHRR